MSVINVNPDVWLGRPAPIIWGEGRVLAFDESEACGFHAYKIVGVGEIALLDHIEIIGGVDINTPTLEIENVLRYEETLVTGPLTIPICFSGVGIVEVSNSFNTQPCFQWEFPDALKRKIMSVLSLKPLYVTNDLNEILGVHRLLLPELGEGIDFELPGVRDNLSKQSRIQFKVLKSKTVGTIAERVVRNWLVGVLCYDDEPCLILMNAYWDEYTNYPLRYILGSLRFKNMIEFIQSLLFPKQCSNGINLYNTEHDANTLRFKLRSESYTMVLENSLTPKELMEMDKNISKFLSIYTSYVNV